MRLVAERGLGDEVVVVLRLVLLDFCGVEGVEGEEVVEPGPPEELVVMSCSCELDVLESDGVSASAWDGCSRACSVPAVAEVVEA